MYNGLFLMVDDVTGTYWNHMTGEALHGPDVGKRLEIRNLVHTTAAQAVEADPSFADAHYRYGAALLAGGGSKEEAVAHLKRYLALAPGGNIETLPSG